MIESKAQEPVAQQEQADSTERSAELQQTLQNHNLLIALGARAATAPPHFSMQVS